MTSTSEPFVSISQHNDLDAVKEILRGRLPRSAHNYNMIHCKARFPEDVYVYTLNGDLNPTAIIFMKTLRKDYEQDLSISVPLEFNQQEELREALINTKVIDWDADFFFTSMDPKISPVIVEVSNFVKNNSIEYLSNYQFVYDVDDVLRFEFVLDKNVELRPLDATTDAHFVTNNWKYSRNGTFEYVQKMIKGNPSAGVFVDGKLVCGTILNIHGLFGFLFSDPDYRRHGFAQICVKYLAKQMVKIGMVPCSTCQRKNIKSVHFHKKLGMKLAQESNYVLSHSPFKE